MGDAPQSSGSGVWLMHYQVFVRVLFRILIANVWM